MKKLMILLATVGLLGGCSTTKYVWTKLPITEEQFKQDNYQCTQESQTNWSGGGSGLNKPDKVCMEARGYELVRSSKASTTGITSVTPELVILKVHPNFPADKAGIKIGDRIIAKNGTPLKGLTDLRAMPKLRIGEQVEYTILRNGKEFTVTLIAIPASYLNPFPSISLGSLLFHLYLLFMS
jgi:C-terminal processing protease CtpA/Prc